MAVHKALAEFRADASRRARPTLIAEASQLLGTATKGRYSAIRISEKYAVEVFEGTMPIHSGDSPAVNKTSPVCACVSVCPGWPLASEASRRDSQSSTRYSEAKTRSGDDRSPNSSERCSTQSSTRSSSSPTRTTSYSTATLRSMSNEETTGSAGPKGRDLGRCASAGRASLRTQVRSHDGAPAATSLQPTDPPCFIPPPNCDGLETTHVHSRAGTRGLLLMGSRVSRRWLRFAAHSFTVRCVVYVAYRWDAAVDSGFSAQRMRLRGQLNERSWPGTRSHGACSGQR